MSTRTNHQTDKVNLLKVSPVSLDWARLLKKIQDYGHHHHYLPTDFAKEYDFLATQYQGGNYRGIN